MSKRMLGTFLTAALAVVMLAAVGRAQGPAPEPRQGPDEMAPAAPGPDFGAMDFDDDLGLGLLALDDAPAPEPGMGAGPGGMAPRMEMGRGGMMPGMGMGMGRGMGRHMGRRMGRGMELGGFGGMEVGLTQEQRDKMADIRDRQMRAGIRARADMELAQLDLRKAMRADRPDRAAIDQQIDRLARMRADLQKARVGTLLDMRAVLTAEQLQKLRERRGTAPRARMRDREHAPDGGQ